MEFKSYGMNDIQKSVLEENVNINTFHSTKFEKKKELPKRLLSLCVTKLNLLAKDFERMKNFLTLSEDTF